MCQCKNGASTLWSVPTRYEVWESGLSSPYMHIRPLYGVKILKITKDVIAWIKLDEDFLGLKDDINIAIIYTWCLKDRLDRRSIYSPIGRYRSTSRPMPDPSVWWHYSDVIMGARASQITSLTIVYLTIYSAQIKENIKAPRHWPLCGEFTGDRWIPRTNGQLRGKWFHLRTPSWL